MQFGKFTMCAAGEKFFKILQQIKPLDTIWQARYVRCRRKFFDFLQQIKPLDAILQARYVRRRRKFFEFDSKLNLYSSKFNLLSKFLIYVCVIYL